MLLVLFVMMAIYHVAPSIRILALPVFLLLATLTATGVALWFSALGVKYRDFMYALPFLVQVWMYASPVVYPMSLIPARWQLWFALNPATGFIEGFRWSVLGTGAFDQRLLLITIAVSIVSFLSGTFFFRRVERSFADVI
jgi:lipopolysaccharide transport system permease protein